MRVKIKKVYYCEYCKKHGLSAGAMATHEKHCTANPNRVCRMCGRNESIQSLIDKYKKQMSYDEKISIVAGLESSTFENVKQPKLEDILDDVAGCPMCTLTIIRGTKLYEYPYHIEFDLKKSIEEWWEEQNAEDDYAYQ